MKRKRGKGSWNKKYVGDKEYLSRGEKGDFFYGQNAFACLLILYTGLRLAEARGLCWSMIDFEKKLIFVSNTKNRVLQRDVHGK